MLFFVIEEKGLALGTLWPRYRNCFKDEGFGVLWLIPTLFSLILLFSNQYYPILLQLPPQTPLQSSSLKSLNSQSLYLIFDFIFFPQMSLQTLNCFSVSQITSRDVQTIMALLPATGQPYTSVHTPQLSSLKLGSTLSWTSIQNLFEIHRFKPVCY